MDLNQATPCKNRLVEGINLVIGWYYLYQIFLNNIACKVDDTNLFFFNKILNFFHEKRVFFPKEYNFFGSLSSSLKEKRKWFFFVASYNPLQHIGFLPNNSLL